MMSLIADTFKLCLFALVCLIAVDLLAYVAVYAVQFCTGLIRFCYENIRSILDTKFQERLDKKNHVRYSTMTHSDFVQWLTNTCINTPNHVSKYVGCKVALDEVLWYNIKIEVQTEQGTYDNTWDFRVRRPFGRNEDTLYAEKKRDEQLLKESFFVAFKEELDSRIEAANSCKDRAEPKPKPEDKDKWSSLLWRPVQYWKETAEDLKYISDEIDKLRKKEFGDSTNYENNESEAVPAESAKVCEASVVKDVVQPIVKAAAKAKVVAPYQNKMDRLTKQYKEYETELYNLGMETTNYQKCLDTIQNEFNRQCDYVARISEIERKQSTPSDNEKTAEISKKIRCSYKAHKDEAVKSIESLIDSAEQVVVLMQQDLQNQIFDAHAQVETGKISDMLAKLKGSVQLDKEINGKAAKICLELKGIEPKTENNEG